MDDLVRWLGEQLDEDERIALAAIRAVGDAPGGVPGAANWRFGNAYTDEGGTYWQITTMPPDADVFGPVELVGSGMSGGGAHEPEIARHAVEHDPARVLREIDAKRKQIAWCVATIGERNLSRYGDFGRLKDDPDALAVTLAVETLRLASQPYVDRPGYRAEWAPSQ